MGAIGNAQEGRTSISIAHRLSTIANVDKIFVINQGKVAESGTHQELLNKDGVYASMWNTQAMGAH
jgi:ABC-type multidrug transport system fused ATPase/permease subunit